MRAGGAAANNSVARAAMQRSALIGAADLRRAGAVVDVAQELAALNRIAARNSNNAASAARMARIEELVERTRARVGPSYTGGPTVTIGRDTRAYDYAIRHLIEDGYDPAPVVEAIRQNVANNIPKIPQGYSIRNVVINNVPIEYRIMRLANDSINSGRITTPG